MTYFLWLRNKKQHFLKINKKKYLMEENRTENMCPDFFNQMCLLCMIFTILLTLGNSELKRGLLIKLFCFSSDFDETW